jgi:hypothetical protein
MAETVSNSAARRRGRRKTVIGCPGIKISGANDGVIAAPSL